MIDTTTANPFLDATLRLDRSRGPLIQLEPQEFHCSSIDAWGDGFVHHSVLQALGVECAWSALNEPRAVATQVNALLVAPGRLASGTIRGEGELLRRGRQAMMAEGRIWQDERLLMVVTASFVRLPDTKGWRKDSRSA